MAADSQQASCAEGRPARASLAAALILAAATFLFMEIDLSNAAFYPLFDAVLPAAREINVASGMLMSLALVMVSMRAPRLLRAEPVGAVAALLALGGVALCVFGIRLGWPALLCAGAAVLGLAGTWINTLCALARCRLSHRELLVGVPVAYGLAHALSWLFLQGPSQAALAVFALCPLAAYLCARGAAHGVLAEVRAAPAQADAQLLRPQSFLPLTNRLFIGLFVATIAMGFNLRFGAQEGNLDAVVPVVVVCLVMALFNLGLRRAGARADAGTGESRELRPQGAAHQFDTMFACAVALIVAGFLVAPLASLGRVTSCLIAMGGAVLNVLFALVITAASVRNPASSVCLACWSGLVSSIASIIGANVGALVAANAASDTAFLLSAVVACALLLYVLVGMRGFSFDATIEGIEPYRAPQAAGEDGAGRIDLVCAEVGGACGLTPRETEVLALLARGRNNAHIQEELSLTRNTVKTYVKRIYGKLGVHSQQEVIDLVEGAPGPLASD